MIMPMGIFTASAVTSGTTGDCTWTLDGTVLTISGEGEMGHCNYEAGGPWGQKITKVIIQKGVTKIGGYSFAYCSLLTDIDIPSSITIIDEYAFSGCRSLKNIDIPGNVTSIGLGAFQYCESITNIDIPNSVTTIKGGAFAYCSSLKSIEIPNNLMSINDDLFYGCTSLSRISIPKSVTTIGKRAFYKCSSLKNVYYVGTDEDWRIIAISSENDCIKTATIHYNITGIPGVVTSVEISKLPDKVHYIKNEELDLTGGVLTVNYDNGVTQDIDLTTIDVVGFDNSVLGKQTLTVKYGDFSAEFEIEVLMRPIAFVAISHLPEKTEYTIGEKLDLTGGKIAIVYLEGGFEFFDITADMVSGFDSNKAGVQILIVKYEGFAVQLAVTVYSKPSPDLDCDGNLTVTDAVLLRNNLLNSAISEDLAYDINGDGISDARDLVNIKKQIANLK